MYLIFIEFFLCAGSYLLTQKDVFFNYERARFLASAIITRDDPSLRVELPPPAILKVSLSSSINLSILNFYVVESHKGGYLLLVTLYFFRFFAFFLILYFVTLYFATIYFYVFICNCVFCNFVVFNIVFLFVASYVVDWQTTFQSYHSSE